MGVPDRVIEHASRAQQLEEVGLTPAGIAAHVRSLAAAIGMVAVRETA
jgi:deoxyxylulose-5-phosphate synthase